MTFITSSPGKLTFVDHDSSDITKAIIFSGMVALVIRALSITGLQLHLSTTPVVNNWKKSLKVDEWLPQTGNRTKD